MGLNHPFNRPARHVGYPIAAFPGYVTGRFYPITEANLASATAVPSADLLYVYPFRVPRDIVPSSLRTRVVTGGASSAVKLGIWLNDPATGRPGGLPLTGLVSNTEQSTATSTTDAAIATTGRLSADLVYWFGSVFKATLPTMLSVTAPNTYTGALGRTSMGIVQTCALSTPFVQSGDITALDLDGVTWTDVNGAGAPLAYLVAP